METDALELSWLENTGQVHMLERQSESDPKLSGS